MNATVETADVTNPVTILREAIIARVAVGIAWPRTNITVSVMYKIVILSFSRR